MKAIAFHLPQFHRTDENDGWWGAGFTDWDNVRAAAPVAEGHVIRKPHADIGYYDLLDPAVRRRQAEMAKAFHLHGFCYYHYWFGGGRRVLDKPLELLLSDGEPNLPFCFCWANEQWTRRWKGSQDEVLMAQTYGDEAEWRAHFEYLLPFFKHPNYIRVEGKPVFYVYRPHEMENAAGRFALWREEARKHGLPGLHLIGKTEDWMPYGYLDLFDAAGEFPPHAPVPPIHATQYPGALSGWDNTPRYGHRGGRRDVTPDSFERDLHAAGARAPGKMIFVFAWNEWGEGATLEPDTHHGYEFLKRLQSVVVESKDRRTYAVQIVSCEGFEHRCFDDNAHALAAAIRATGRDVTLSEGSLLSPDRTTVLFGANLYRHLPLFYREALTPDAIVYNMEQAFPGSTWFDHADDIDYRLFDVWDYSTRNQELLGARGIATRHVPMSVVSSDTPPQPKTCDVAFLGHYAGRRDELVKSLEARGVSVRWQRSGLWGADREAFYGQARVTLNVSFNGPHGIFEEARVSYLVAQGHFVVSERSSDPRLEAPYEGIVVFGRYDEIPDLVARWLLPERTAEREARALLGRQRMKERFAEVVAIVDRLLTEKETQPMKRRVPFSPPPPAAATFSPPSASAATPLPSSAESILALHHADLEDTAYAPFLQTVRRLSEGARVVEVGTGYGRVARAILAAPAASLTTIDRSPFTLVSSTDRTPVTALVGDAAAFGATSCDLLVVDATSYPDAKSAFAHAAGAKRIAVHGTHAFREHGEDPRLPGVYAAVVELANASGGELSVEEQWNAGLGYLVLRRGS